MNSIKLFSCKQYSITHGQALVNRDKKQIDLAWNNDDLALNCFIYQEVNDNSFILYKTFDGNVETFIGKDISKNNTYRYKI